MFSKIRTHSDATATELIFLGTGTSSSIPHVDCLTYDPAIHTPCKTCLSTLRPEGKKNVRRNTGAVLRAKAKSGRTVYVLHHFCIVLPIRLDMNIIN